MIVACVIREDVVFTTAVFEDFSAAEAFGSDVGADRVEDVTDANPRPLPGWSWPAGESPVAPIVDPFRASRVKSKELIDRFTVSEWEMLTSHTSNLAKAFVARTQVCGVFDLDDPRLIDALDRAVQAGILTSERPAEIRGLS